MNEINIQESFLNHDDASKVAGPVTCLGMTFANDQERRTYFTEELRKKLPELKQIEGFPLGEDEDILVLSDPPYFTACPNPFIPAFIEQWEKEKEVTYGPEKEDYHREPFATDVSEGKNDPIYNAHSYHTKVPHKAIMRYILHYTRPGDIIFDGFCGTGMTGVAAQMCGNRNTVLELGYQVQPDGTLLREETNEADKTFWVPFSKLGVRRAILTDLSPAATFIAYNYNTPVDVQAFEREVMRILAEVEQECSWMYETKHADGRPGKINYTVWSDVFICPECSREVVFWKESVDEEVGSVKDEFPCPNCSANLTKRKMERAWVTKYDSVINETIRQAKQVPVYIKYTIDGKREGKPLDEFDLALIDRIEQSELPYWFPSDRMMEGQETRRNDPAGITHVHHFYTKRNLWVLAALLSKLHAPASKILFQSIVVTLCSRLVRYNLGNRGNGPLSGTLYVPSLNAETEIIKVAKGKVKDFVRAFIVKDQSLITSQSSESMTIPSSSQDYIFIDPPFGANLNYSELNFLWESWLKVWTNNKSEAIENSVQGKGLNEYRYLMTNCFREAYRVLKPGRWMTIEFSNTKASVWNSIQTALTDAGFIVANVSALDKQQGSFKAVTTTTAVKQDLVISAYKPSNEMKASITNSQNTEESVWSFVRGHLAQLPVFIGKKGFAGLIIERTPRVLFDRMVSYYVQNGFSVPISSGDFQAGLVQRFPPRDGMIFLETQVAEYDKKRLLANDFMQMSLFVSDENSAIEWLRQQLLKKPQTRQDLHPEFMKEIQHISKYEILPELDILLEQNFLQYEGTGPVPSQIHAYLSTNYKDLRELEKEDTALMHKAKERWYVPDPNKQADLEKLREKSLLREFGTYINEIKGSKKKLKLFRLEAIRAGFKKAWSEKDYQTIVEIGSKIPDAVLQEDDKLLMYFDNAQTRLE
ncbi:MAG: DNA methyltransferase [Desulfosporosinus sp.]